MTTLYLLNRRHTAGQLTDLLAAGDTVVLCGDAVQCWQQHWPRQVSVHVLSEDALARNLTAPATQAGIDYPELVQLCGSRARVIAW